MRRRGISFIVGNTLAAGDIAAVVVEAEGDIVVEVVRRIAAQIVDDKLAGAAEQFAELELEL